jgi:hypothetical protein
MSADPAPEPGGAAAGQERGGCELSEQAEGHGEPRCRETASAPGWNAHDVTLADHGLAAHEHRLAGRYYVWQPG